MPRLLYIPREEPGEKAAAAELEGRQKPEMKGEHIIWSLKYASIFFFTLLSRK